MKGRRCHMFGVCRSRGLIVAVLLVALVAGCNRSRYRRMADQEAYGLIGCGTQDPRWALPDYGIEPNPQSRMFDPDNPDCPPMPPDDPTSHTLMHNVDCKKGWKHWHRNGDTPYTENPCWRAYLPTDETGAVVLNRESVVRLSLLNSREYQRELEELYLSALDVTLERFLLDTRFFGGHSTFFDNEGRLRGQTGAGTHLGSHARSTLDVENDLSLRRKFATGGELLAGIANSIVWQFSGPDTYSAFTIMDFSLVQPLLRGAGRAVVLERLTDSERALLANIRQMERFRRGFYGQIIAGLNPGQGPSRAGLALTLPPLNTAAGGGIFGLMEEQVQIRNLRSNVDSLEDSLEMLQAAYDAGRIENRYQVDLARQAMLNAQSRLLSLRTAHEDRLDAYKITLGLPPDLGVSLRDDLLRKFDLMDPELMELREAVDLLLRQLRDPTQVLPPDYLDQVAQISHRSKSLLEMVQEDVQRLLDSLPERRKNLARIASRPELRDGEVDPVVADVAALEKRVEVIRQDFAGLLEPLQATTAALEAYQPPPPAPQPDGQPAPLAGRDEQLQDLVSRLAEQLLQLSVIEAMARLDTITILPVDLEAEQALQIASSHRLDWMNARAAVVDRWRQIEVVANRLKAGLDVYFSGDLSTTDNHPLRFRGPTGALRVGLQFDAPLTRLEERNLYRETLIRYEQARRDYTAFVDRINQSLRNTLRTLRTTQLNLEVRRAAVLVSITQVDLARMRLLRPPKMNETSAVSATVGRDLVTAITGLLDAQNNFLGVWVDYETQRMNLDFELGTMQLDAAGMWIDPGAMTAGALGASATPEMIPPGPEQAPGAPEAEPGLFPPPPPPLPPAAPVPPAPPAPPPAPEAKPQAPAVVPEP